MSARPKPWEMAQALPSTSSFSYASSAEYSISPTFQSGGSYLGSYNYCQTQTQTQAQFSAESQPHIDPLQYNPPPITQNWATSGPTISPELGAFNNEGISFEGDNYLDPLTPGQSRRTSSNRLSPFQPSSAGGAGAGAGAGTGILGTFDGMDGSSFSSLDDGTDTFNDYMDFEFGQNPSSKLPQVEAAFENGTSDSIGMKMEMAVTSPAGPGVFPTSSSSTPAPTSRPTISNGQSQDHTPTSSQSF